MACCVNCVYIGGYAARAIRSRTERVAGDPSGEVLDGLGALLNIRTINAAFADLNVSGLPAGPITPAPQADSPQTVWKMGRVVLRLIDDEHVQAGRRISRSRRPSAARATGPRIDRASIRAWANEQGLHVSERGRISAEVMQKYEAAH